MNIENLFFLFQLIISGYCISVLLMGQKNHLILIGLSVGMGMIYIFLFSALSFILGIPVGFAIISSIFLTLLLILKSKIKIQHIRIEFADKTQLLLTILILLYIVFVFIQSFIHPLIAWDGYASWFFGAKALYLQGRIDPEFYNFANYDFPFLFQSVAAFQSYYNGVFLENNTLLLFPLIYISILVLFYAVLSRNTEKKYALYITLLLAGTHEIVRHGGYLDLGHIDILMSYLILSVVCVYLFFLDLKNFKTFAIFELLITALVFTKNEGLPFYILFQILVLFKLKKVKNQVKYLPIISLFLLPTLMWIFFKSVHLPTNYRFIAPYFSHMDLLLKGMINILQEFINFQRWNLMWVFIFLSLPLIVKIKEYREILLIFAIQLFIYVFIYFISPVNPIEEINGSFDRLLLQIYPSLLLIAALTFYRFKKNLMVR